MGKRLKYGMIGCGYVSRRHIEAIKSLEETELKTLCDVDISRAENFAQEFGGLKAENDYKKVLSDPEIDVVIICLPTYLHSKVAVESAKRKKHIFLEKPIAGSLKEANKIIDACKSNNVKLCIGHAHRFFSPIQNAKKLIESGKLGFIHRAVAFNCYFVDLIKESRNWELNSKI